jgi:hypothetical protein
VVVGGLLSFPSKDWTLKISFSFFLANPIGACGYRETGQTRMPGLIERESECG